MATDDAEDTFVLTKGTARSLKETSMRVKKIRGAMKTLASKPARKCAPCPQQPSKPSHTKSLPPNL